MGGVQEELFSTKRDDTEPEVFINLGGGVDSAAMTARFLLEPAVRTFDLEKATFLHAVVGADDEYADTQDALNGTLLPLMAQHGARLVQVARAGHSTDEGYLVLDDSRSPQRIHRDLAVWNLYDFHLKRAIVPMVSASKRDCSEKAKHFALDHFILDEIGPHRPYRQMLGFGASEGKRIANDLKHASFHRRPEHPLNAWGWTRQDCKDYLYKVFGIKDFPRSCCSYCPFSFRIKDPAELVGRWMDEPRLAARSLFLEFVALTMNPTAMLYGRHSAIDFAHRERMTAAIDAFEQLKADRLWRVYAVRRVWQSQGHAMRSVRVAGETTTRERAQEQVRAVAGASHLVNRFGIHRAHILLRDEEVYPSLEYNLVAAPAVVEPFEIGRFAQAYNLLDPHAEGLLVPA